MAEKGFGVKEINLIGASGTPTIESPNNLNLNAVNVAISTNATIGGNLTVTGNIGIAGTLTYEDVTNVDSIGIVTAREGVFIPDNKKLNLGNTASSADLQIYHDSSNNYSYIKETGSGPLQIQSNAIFFHDAGNTQTNAQITDTVCRLNYSGSTKIATSNTGATVTGTLAATAVTGDGSGLTNLPASTPADTDPQVVFDISASGSSGYIFTGPGNDGSTVNPDIYLMRGQRYRFINTTGSSHPFEFRNADNNADFTDGITGSQSGTQDFNVQYDAPAHLKYRCTIHTGSMVGNIYIRSGADTGASAGTENIEIGGFLRFDNTVSKIVTDTSDGSDNKAILITGGGDTATTRGALAVLYGNELNSGRLDLYSGVGGGNMTFNTGTTTTERLRISGTNGSVGIGTDELSTNVSFYNALTVVGDNTSQASVVKIKRVKSAASNGVYTLQVDSSAHTSNVSSAGAMAVDVNSGRAFTINGLGRIGIGTDNPTTALEVKGDITVSNANNQADIFFGEHGDVADSKALIRMDQNSSTAGTLQFHTESGGTLTERLRIDQNGSVIVANGTLHASRVQAKFGIDCHGLDIYDGVGTVANYGMAFYNDPTTDKANGIGFFNDDGQTCGGYIVHQDKGSGNIGDIVMATSATSNTPVERLRIHSNGCVTKPTNAMFKAVRTSNQAVSSNGWHIIQFNSDTATGCFDIGSNFDTSSHRFTAPVTGYYQFGLNQRIDGGDGDYFRVAFSVDGGGLSGSYPYGHAIYRDTDGFNYYTFSITSLIYLTAGQYVNAYAYSASDTSWTLHDESQFYGYLVG